MRPAARSAPPTAASAATGAAIVLARLAAVLTWVSVSLLALVFIAHVLIGAAR